VRASRQRCVDFALVHHVRKALDRKPVLSEPSLSPRDGVPFGYGRSLGTLSGVSPGRVGAQPHRSHPNRSARCVECRPALP
jgi:hypothetical protein